jgi:hypothetical protein
LPDEGVADVQESVHSSHKCCAFNWDCGHDWGSAVEASERDNGIGIWVVIRRVRFNSSKDRSK